MSAGNIYRGLKNEDVCLSFTQTCNGKILWQNGMTIKAINFCCNKINNCNGSLVTIENATVTKCCIIRACVQHACL
jgi:hypothetical protein